MPLNSSGATGKGLRILDLDSTADSDSSSESEWIVVGVKGARKAEVRVPSGKEKESGEGSKSENGKVQRAAEGRGRAAVLQEQSSRG